MKAVASQVAGAVRLALSCAVLYFTVVYCTVLYCTVLYCSVLYCNLSLKAFWETFVPLKCGLRKFWDFFIDLALTYSDMERLEQVDTSALKDLVTGHSKCSKAFYYIEFGALMIRHIVMIKRLLYHHHIINRDDGEIIKKVYQKQEESSCKGDWVLLVRKDFEFIGENMNQRFILNTSKEEYNKYIKLHSFKGTVKKKMKHLKYDKLAIQSYLVSDLFSVEEKRLLFSLRSMCYPAKMNFQKMNKGNLKCSFQCNQDETQIHIFSCPEQLLKPSCRSVRPSVGPSVRPSVMFVKKWPLEYCMVIKTYLHTYLWDYSDTSDICDSCDSCDDSDSSDSSDSCDKKCCD